MFVEFTDGDNQLVLVNSEKVIVVKDGDRQINVCLIVGESADIKINVRQSFEEVKKRLGLSISPRAETIMTP